MSRNPAGSKEELRAALLGHQRRAIRDPSLTCSAVLIPLTCKDGEWHVAVTQRTLTVDHHKGQISFPGGVCDQGDADLLATTLRETLEEIGVAPESVDVLGVLDDYPTITSFAVTPFVGVLEPGTPYRPNPSEVESVVEVPLSYLQDACNLRVEQRGHEGRLFDVLFWDSGPYTIWGPTAQMLKSFLELLD